MHVCCMDLAINTQVQRYLLASYVVIYTKRCKMKTRSCNHSRACLIAKSSMISSLPPGIAVPRTCGKRGCSLRRCCAFV